MSWQLWSYLGKLSHRGQRSESARDILPALTSLPQGGPDVSQPVFPPHCLFLPTAELHCLPRLPKPHGPVSEGGWASARTQTLINTQGNHKEQPQEGNVPPEEALTGNSPVLISTLACRVRLSSKVTRPEREAARSKQEQSPPLCSPDSSHQCPQPSTFPAHRLETARRRKRLFEVETHNRENYQFLPRAYASHSTGEWCWPGGEPQWGPLGARPTPSPTSLGV